MEKIRIGVLMGGPSAEHDVSLKTGEMILRFLNPNQYAAKGIVISKKGKWPIPPEKFKKKFDLAFIAMHGEYGEDGTLQSILDKNRIRYTGSGVKASRLGMDKAKSLLLFKKNGLDVPKFTVVKGNPTLSEAKMLFGLPLAVKPADRGSSVGVSIVKKLQELPEAIKSALKHSQNVMIQEYINGREFTCGVLEINGKLKPLPPTEIIPRHGRFFDYEAKYLSGMSEEITPPRISQKEIKKIQQAALKAHQAIGARGMSRTDMIWSDKIYVLEINTIPGMTQTSLLPQEAKEAGIEFPEMLNLIVESALNKTR
ncbi:MAG: D-alanine--D-alanine ligase [Patescibacteria group bacterium]|mgnify:CR=1 FL=1